MSACDSWSVRKLTVCVTKAENRTTLRFTHTRLLIAICRVLKRGGPVRLQVGCKRPTKEVLHAFVKAKIADETAMIATDEWKGYEGIADKNTIHATVNHREGEYVRGFVHTNTLENVWSLFKRLIVGSYHQLSVKHLDRLS